MNSLKFLSDQDFSMTMGKKGQNLCIGMGGLVLVLFYANECSHCHSFIPQYKALSSRFPMCQFAMINIGQYQNVAIASMKTSSPVRQVPYLLLYLERKPVIIYTGDFNINALSDFLQNRILTKIQSKTSFVQHKVDPDDLELQTSSGGGIPYNIECDEHSCYVTYGDIKSKRCNNKADGCKECTVRQTMI
jgi:thiol-disulfide isomerase/thioredoxin